MFYSQVIAVAFVVTFNVVLAQDMVMDPKTKAKLANLTDSICKDDIPSEKAQKLLACEDAPKAVSEILKKCRGEAKIPEDPKMRVAHFCVSMKGIKPPKVEMKDTKDVKKEQGKEQGKEVKKEPGKEGKKEAGKDEKVKQEPKKDGQGEDGGNKKKSKRSPGEMMPMVECIMREKDKSPATKEALELFVKNKTSPDGQKALVNCIEKAMG